MNKIEKCRKAFTKLQEFLGEPHMSEAAKAGVIQAFEYTYETFWQCLQFIAKTQGMTNITAPRHAFIFGHSIQIIENDAIWISIMKSRNNTSHTYNETVANEIFQSIKNVYYVEFEKVLFKMEKYFQENVASTT